MFCRLTGIKSLRFLFIAVCSEIAKLNPRNESTVRVAGLVVALRLMNTKRGDRMAFISLSDQNARIEVAVFADVYQKYRDLIVKDALLVVADIPGVDENAVDIRVERRVLTITGRVKPEWFDKHKRAYCEYKTGDYERSFSLSNEVDVNKIEATVKQGVLRLVLPKAEAAKPRKIIVKAG